MNSAKCPNVTSDSPKYYLADVPQELRRRVLDLCTKRLWQDARDLLSQHGFTDYTFDDLQSFYDWAPTELPQGDRSTDSLFAAPVEPLPPVLDQPNRAATVRERSADCPEPARSQQLTTDDPALTGRGASLGILSPPVPGEFEWQTRRRKKASARRTYPSRPSVTSPKTVSCEGGGSST